MAISLSKLKPTEMVRLMNSTDYGTVQIGRAHV